MKVILSNQILLYVNIKCSRHPNEVYKILTRLQKNVINLCNYIFDMPIHFIQKKTDDESTFQAFDTFFSRIRERYQAEFDIELYKMYGNILQIKNLSESYIRNELKSKSNSIPNILLVQSIDKNYNDGDFLQFNLAIILSYLFEDYLTKEMDLTIRKKADDIYDSNQNVLIKIGNPMPNLDSEEDINMMVCMNNLTLPFEFKNWLFNIYLIMMNNAGHTIRNRNILIQLFNYYVFTKQQKLTVLHIYIH